MLSDLKIKGSSESVKEEFPLEIFISSKETGCGKWYFRRDSKSTEENLNSTPQERENNAERVDF